VTSEAPADDVTDPDGRLRLLEGRRLDLSSSMWQVPTLTVAAQAFLLQVLSNDDVGWSVALPIALAGAMASFAAGVSLLQQRSAERLHSREIARLAMSLGLGDPRRKALLEKEGKSDAWWQVPAIWLWLTTLAVFVIADGFALIAARD
jgi:hypothetical protein